MLDLLHLNKVAAWHIFCPIASWSSLLTLDSTYLYIMLSSFKTLRRKCFDSVSKVKNLDLFELKNTHNFIVRSIIHVTPWQVDRVSAFQSQIICVSAFQSHRSSDLCFSRHLAAVGVGGVLLWMTCCVVADLWPPLLKSPHVTYLFEMGHCKIRNSSYIWLEICGVGFYFQKFHIATNY